MKKLIVLTLCIAGLFSCSQKRPSVVERPVFEVWNSTTLEIDKIEMSDTATVFYIDAYFKPDNWIRIAGETYIRESGGSDKLFVSGSEGINLDEETWMPESGTMSFKLFFPPLKPGITQIDFIESDCPDCFKIWGIRLLPNAKIKIDPIPKEVAKTADEPLPKPAYNIQPARISGRLLGYDKSMEHSNITLTLFNILQCKQIETALSITEDGSFSGEITPGFPGIYESSAGPLFLTPGKESKLYIDLKKRSRYQSRYRTDKEPGDSIYTYISGGFTPAELVTIDQVKRSFFSGVLPDLTDTEKQKFYRDIVNMNPEAFKQYVLDIMNKRLDEVNQKGYSPQMRMMMTNAIKIQVYTVMMEYEGLIVNANVRLNNITTREEVEKILLSIEKPGAEYYSFLKEAHDDNMSYLPNFVSLVEYLNNYSSFFILSGNRKNNPAKERIEFFKEKWELVIGEEKGILFDMVQALHYGWQLFDMNYFTDAEKQEIQAYFKDNPLYAETLIAESDRMEILLSATKDNKESIINELPDVSQDQMLDAILAKYKDKVVVVDFWGTWCAPCLLAMKTVLPLKEEMKGKDVAWLYIADGTSPLDTWKQTCPGIAGEHYYVSRAQTDYWGIQAYPTYMVYDRQGKQLTRYVNFPGIDVMKNTIEKGM